MDEKELAKFENTVPCNKWTVTDFFQLISQDNIWKFNFRKRVNKNMQQKG